MSTTSLFKNNFMPKKAPSRKATTVSQLQLDAAERAREFALDYKTAHMTLSGQHFRFDSTSGEWLDDGTGDNLNHSSKQLNSKRQEVQLNRSNSKEMLRIQKVSQQLHEENNLLKVKNEILVDMMSEICSEYKFEMNKGKNTNK